MSGDSCEARVFPARREGSSWLVKGQDVARALGWEAKVVTPGKLVTLCQEDVCVPLRLDTIAHTYVDETLYLDARALGEALGQTAEPGGESVTFTRAEAAPSASRLPAYNAAWGEGRGFRPGQTVPDLPLFDLEGNEVRFSKFLGQQYIIYVWASW